MVGYVESLHYLSPSKYFTIWHTFLNFILFWPVSWLQKVSAYTSALSSEIMVTHWWPEGDQMNVKHTPRCSLLPAVLALHDKPTYWHQITYSNYSSLCTGGKKHSAFSKTFFTAAHSSCDPAVHQCLLQTIDTHRSLMGGTRSIAKCMPFQWVVFCLVFFSLSLRCGSIIELCTGYKDTSSVH